MTLNPVSDPRLVACAYTLARQRGPHSEHWVVPEEQPVPDEQENSPCNFCTRLHLNPRNETQTRHGIVT